MCFRSHPTFFSFRFPGLSAIEEQILSLKYLVYLLPVPNRDTLFALLHFLSTVDAHSTDAVDEYNETVRDNIPGCTYSSFIESDDGNNYTQYTTAQ